MNSRPVPIGRRWYLHQVWDFGTYIELMGDQYQVIDFGTVLTLVTWFIYIYLLNREERIQY